MQFLIYEMILLDLDTSPARDRRDTASALGGDPRCVEPRAAWREGSKVEE